jgi:hypothetical protein
MVNMLYRVVTRGRAASVTDPGVVVANRSKFLNLVYDVVCGCIQSSQSAASPLEAKSCCVHWEVRMSDIHHLIAEGQDLQRREGSCGDDPEMNPVSSMLGNEFPLTWLVIIGRRLMLTVGSERVSGSIPELVRHALAVGGGAVEGAVDEAIAVVDETIRLCSEYKTWDDDNQPSRRELAATAQASEESARACKSVLEEHRGQVAPRLG